MVRSTGPSSHFSRYGLFCEWYSFDVQSRPLWVFIFVLCVIAGVLRIAPLGRESVDGDELFSRRVALAPASTSLEMVKNDLVHPPLYYFVLKGALPVFGDRPFGLRSVSLLAGIGAVGLVALLGRGEAVLAALLLALNAKHIFYSQQARSYSLYVLLFVVLLLWAFVLDKYQARLEYWLGGSAVMAALVYTHYMGAFFVAFLLVALWLGRHPVRTKRYALAAGTAAALSFLPWLFAEVPVYRGKGLGENLAWQSVPDLFSLRAFYASALGIADIRGGTMLAFGLGCLLVTLAIWRNRTTHRELLRILLATAIGPVIIIYILASKPLLLPIFGDRHLLPAVVSWMLLVSLAVWTLPRAWMRYVATGLLAVLQLAPALTGPGVSERHPYQKVAEALAPASEAIYTTWPYGIGETVSFYLPEGKRVSALPGDPAQLPATFILLHRPGVPREQTQVNRLAQAGFEHRNGEYYVAPVNPQFGTRLSFWRRP